MRYCSTNLSQLSSSLLFFWHHVRTICIDAAGMRRMTPLSSISGRSWTVSTAASAANLFALYGVAADCLRQEGHGPSDSKFIVCTIPRSDLYPLAILVSSGVWCIRHFDNDWVFAILSDKGPDGLTPQYGSDILYLPHTNWLNSLSPLSSAFRFTQHRITWVSHRADAKRKAYHRAHVGCRRHPQFVMEMHARSEWIQWFTKPL
jgi:hypothetical protein